MSKKKKKKKGKHRGVDYNRYVIDDVLNALKKSIENSK